MPELTLLIAILSVVALALVIIDCLKESEFNSEAKAEHNHQDELSNLLILVAPYLALIYPDKFWLGLLALCGISLATFSLQWVSYKTGWLRRPPEYIYLLPGSCIVSVVLYFIIFHDGPLQMAQLEIIKTEDKNQWSWVQLWPWALYIAGILVAAGRKGSGGMSVASLIMIVLFNLLPFFTGYYWTSMLAGLAVFAVILNRLVPRLEISIRGGFAFVSAFAYMLAASISVVIYALLY